MHNARLGCISTFFSFLILTSYPALSSDDLFSNSAATLITGNVLINDPAGATSAQLVFEPRNGSLQSAEGAAGIGVDGGFIYTPNEGFEGMDAFVYTVVVDGQEQAYQVRLFSGAIQIIDPNDPQQVLGVESFDNRTPVKLLPRNEPSGTTWRVSGMNAQLRFTTASAEQPVRSLETWQPNARGTDVTIYSSNNRLWQRFGLSTSQFGSDQIESAYTGFSLFRTGGQITAAEPNGTSSDDWVFAGAQQTPPPSARDDRFTTAVDTAVEGNVLANDDANSIDFASFLVTPPSNGEFVGINQVIYGGLAPFGRFSYQPNPGFEGADSFTYIALGSSSGAPSKLVTVNIRVGNENNPVAGDDLFFSQADAVISGRVLGNDTNEGGGFFDPAAVLISPPRFGDFIGINQSIYGGLAPFGAFDYQPQAGFNGVDSFAYKINNSGEESAVATVYLIVGDVRMAPRSNWRLSLGSTSSGNRSPFIIGDADSLVSETFKFSPRNQTGAFTLNYANKAMETWQPSGSGRDATLYSNNGQAWQQFSISLSDGGALKIRSDYTNRFLQPVTINEGAEIEAALVQDSIQQEWLVAGPNQAYGPTGRDDEFSIAKDTLLSGRVLNNDDANGFDLLALPVTQPSNGQLVGLGQSIYDGITPWGAFDYQPNPGFVGQDSFVYQVLSSFDGASSRFVTVRINVTQE